MLVDLMIPYWGAPETLSLTLNSVVAQTNPAWRATVVDDDYPGDEAERIVARLRDPRISYVRNAVNQGIAGNFQRCVDLASHELVVVLGFDDLLLPGYVDTILAAHAVHPDVAIIQPGVRVVDEAGIVSRTLVDTVKSRVLAPRGNHEVILSGQPLAASLLRGDWLYWPSLAFRRDVLAAHRFDQRYAILLDLSLIIDIVIDGGRLLYVPTDSFRYRRHSSSASSHAAFDGSRFRDERQYFAEVASRLEAHGWDRAARAARWHVTSRAHAVTLLPLVLRAGDLSAARTLLRHAFAR